MTTPSNLIVIRLLADDARLIATIGELRWREWGHAPEPEDLDWWIDVTAREAGRDRLPVTWVAVNGRGDALGAVGLGEYDIEERQDRSPWVLGMIVRPDHRELGIGRLLMSHLEAWAGDHGYKQIWVANEGPAIGFYQKCGWALCETVERIRRDGLGTEETSLKPVYTWVDKPSSQAAKQRKTFCLSKCIFL